MIESNNLSSSIAKCHFFLYVDLSFISIYNVISKVWEVLFMGKGNFVISALKIVGNWVAQNPTIVMNAADKVVKLKPEDKVNQLGAAVLELDKKIDDELVLVHKQLHIMKIILSVMFIVLTVLLIIIILLSIKVF